MTPGPSPLSRPAYVHLLCLQVTFGLAFSTFLMLPKYLVAQGAGAAAVGLVNGAFALGATLAAPLVARATARFGPVACLAAASTAMAAGSLGFAFVSSAGALAVGLRLVQGMAAAFTFSVGTLIVAALVPAERLTSAFALFITAGVVTTAVAPAAAEWLMAHHGGTPAFLGAAACALAGLVPCRWLSTTEAARPPTRSAAAAPADAATRARLDRATLGVVALSAVFGLASGVMFTFHQPLALERGVRRVSDFLVAFTLTVTLLRLSGGRLMDRAGSRTLARWAFAGYAFALGGMIALQPGQLAGFGVAIGLFHGLLLPSLMALALEPGGGSREARAAWMNAGMNVGGLGVAALGPIAARTGYPAIFVGAGAILAASAVALRPRPRG
jgi:MFS family permease